MADPAPKRRLRPLVLLLRWGVPLALIVFGVIMIIMGHGHIADISDQPSGSVFTSIPTDHDSVCSAVGVSAIIIALMFLLLGFLLRFNSSDEADRQREEAAREYFTRTGRWPGERGPSST